MFFSDVMNNNFDVDYFNDRIQDYVGSDNDVVLDQILLEEFKKIVINILEVLNERENAVISMRFGLLDDESDRTLEEISKEFNVTRARISQIESKAIKKLQNNKSVFRKLNEYLTL